jgi:hypothetical protein
MQLVSRLGTLVVALTWLTSLTACDSYRYAYADARSAKSTYRECLKRNPGDPGACEAERSAAGEQIENWDERQRCDSDPTLCR